MFYKTFSCLYNLSDFSQQREKKIGLKKFDPDVGSVCETGVLMIWKRYGQPPIHSNFKKGNIA